MRLDLFNLTICRQLADNKVSMYIIHVSYCVMDVYIYCTHSNYLNGKF